MASGPILWLLPGQFEGCELLISRRGSRHELTCQGTPAFFIFHGHIHRGSCHINLHRRQSLPAAMTVSCACRHGHCAAPATPGRALIALTSNETSPQVPKLSTSPIRTKCSIVPAWRSLHNGAYCWLFRSEVGQLNPK